MNYHGIMRLAFPPAPTPAAALVGQAIRRRFGWVAALAALLLLGFGHGPAAAQPASQPSAPALELQFPGPPTALDAETFYQLLLAEFKFQRGDPGGAHSLMLDAAVRLQRPELFRRAVDMALQSRAGNSAFNAARDWSRAFPDSDEPLRFQLQILLALNRPGEIGPVLQRLIQMTPIERRHDIISAIPATLGRLSDRAAARRAVHEALQAALADPATAATAHAALGRMDLLQGDHRAALQAAQQALQLQADSVHGATLALDLLPHQSVLAEALLRAYLERTDAAGAAQRHDLHLAYVQSLLELRRVSDAQRELRLLTERAPDLASAWLLQGILQTNSRRPGPARTALLRYLELAPGLPAEQAARGRTQAYLHLAQLDEWQRDWAAAQAWLERIPDPDGAGFALQLRRAHLLARQGQVEAARQLLREQPELDDAQARRKLVAEAQLLRDIGQYEQALQIYGQAMQQFPDDPDLLYEKALTAKRAGQYEAMEQMLRLLMQRHPDYHHAYNALGYSLADRNLRLQEARSLIEKALAVDPNDAYILDSMGWVEFRLGNHSAALRYLKKAFERLPDAEIAAHLGEVHWVLGQREQALAVWRLGLEINPDNETLLQTLRRLQAQP